MIAYLSRAALAASLVLAALVIMPSAGMAADIVTLGPLELTRAFTRAMPPNAPTGGGFVTITNTGDVPDRLVSASSSRAREVQLHEMKMDNNVMVMRELKGGIDIPAGATVALEPGGMHLMFIGASPGFATGETVPVTLVFERAGTITLELPVAPLGATEMPMTMN